MKHQIFEMKALLGGFNIRMEIAAYWMVEFPIN